VSSRRICIFGWADSVHVHRWAEGLTSRGFEVKVVSLDGWNVKGCETVIYPRSGRWSYLKYAAAAAEEARRFKADLLHAHYLTGFGMWAVRASVRPCVVSVWGADIVDFPKGLFRRMMVRSILKRATHITATSEFLKNVVSDLRPEAAEKTTVIPFGVTVPDQVAPMPPVPPVKLCFIKNHKPKYGADYLLQAMARVLPECPEVSLSLAGSGEMTGKLKALADVLKLGDAVTFTGHIDKEEMYTFLGEHHIMVMPSVMDSESFGVAVLEASACGRPVIASRVGGVPEVLADGRTGMLVPPRDVEALSAAIIGLVRDAGIRQEMGRAGHLFARDEYSWDRSLDQMSDLYERLIYAAKK